MSALPGIAFVVSGPSGAGKTTLLRRALAADPKLRFSVSHTTRPPRSGEVEGRDYWFVDEDEFARLRDAGEFLEWAPYQGHLYGTSRGAVDTLASRGFDVILEVEIEGARQLRERLEQGVFVFVLPPSMGELERRLRGRASDGDSAIDQRLKRAHDEIRAAARLYDYLIVNDELERAVNQLLHVVGAARVSRDRMLATLRDRFEF
ncbi:MAG: guanylate kinase [Myxococcota bacterium]